jgi:hypothetical protein
MSQASVFENVRLRAQIIPRIARLERFEKNAAVFTGVSARSTHACRRAPFA